MKTKEFIKEIEALGLEIDVFDGDLLIGDMKRNYCRSSSEERYKLEVYHEHLEKLEEETRHKLLDLVVEYVKTPIEEREEPKKYYLKLPTHYRKGDSGYLNYLKYGKHYTFNNNIETIQYQTKFTQEEIDSIPNQDFIKTLIKEEVDETNV